MSSNVIYYLFSYCTNRKALLHYKHGCHGHGITRPLVKKRPWGVCMACLSSFPFQLTTVLVYGLQNIEQKMYDRNVVFGLQMYQVLTYIRVETILTLILGAR